jgi:hypothetical protein
MRERVSCPGLTASEARHRLVPSEGQKENKRKNSVTNGGKKKMTKNTNSKQKMLAITILLSMLMISSAAVFAPEVQATELTIQEKGLTILNDVVGIDVAEYTTTPKTLSPNSYFDVIPQENVEYNLKSEDSTIKLRCTFANRKLQMIYVLENYGTPKLTKTASNALEKAKTFLSDYQSYSGNSLYEEMKSMLNKVDFEKNPTTTSGNIKLQAITSGDRVSFAWTYMFNGVESAYKCVTLAYEDGFLKGFFDAWNLYNIGNTTVNLSEEEAVAIAIERAKAYSWKAGSDNGTFEVTDFNVTGAMVTQLVFASSLYADTPRNDNLLTLYPMWRIGVSLDKFYPGNVYGIWVDVWADTKEIRHVQAAFTTLSPELIGNAPFSENAAAEVTTAQVTSVEEHTNSSTLGDVALPAFAILILGTVSLYLFRKKTLRIHRLPRISLFINGVLLCLLMFSMLLLVPISKANATIPEPEGRDTIWGCTWSKGSYLDEIEQQEDTAEYVSNRFSNNDYSTDNYQGDNTVKANILGNISDGEQGYHRSAVVYFDHGIGEFVTGDNNNWHFSVHDSNGAKVYDMDIYDETDRGKNFFSFINTCMSANLTGYYCPEGGGKHQSGTAVGLPFAFTHRTVIPKNTQGFNTEENMSDDGYDDADDGDFCYIGFPWGSASLNQTVDTENYGDTYYHSWVEQFFYIALADDCTVNQALDMASYQCFGGQLFGETALHNNFTAIWPPLAPGINSTMAVYGNGNIHLYQYDFTLNAEDQWENTLSNKDVYVDSMYNVANTGTTMKITGGDHSLFVNDFWEAGYTGYRYTFQNYTYGGTTYFLNPAEWDFSDDWTRTANFKKEYCPGDANGDGEADEDDWALVDDAYPSQRGDPEYNSACDFNNDGDVDVDDRSYLADIVPLDHTLTVYAFNQYYTAGEVPLEIDDEYVGPTMYGYTVTDGVHKVYVPEFIDQPPYGYHVFDHFDYGAGTTPMNVTVTSDLLATAYYYSYYY